MNWYAQKIKMWLSDDVSTRQPFAFGTAIKNKMSSMVRSLSESLSIDCLHHR